MSLASQADQRQARCVSCLPTLCLFCIGRNDHRSGQADKQTSVARAILSALDYIPTVLILSQDAFYSYHSPEELELAFKNDLDLGVF
jgi:hypothetical protein